ncbi:MAG: hypothetical protein V5A68_00480 [Candidatus Thermoplasmatota archaeon]
MWQLRQLKDKEIFHNLYFQLALIAGIAILIRSIPAWINAAWGCDFGIYYGLTNSFVETRELFNPYQGWGSSYEYFPVLYAITGLFHWLTGLDIVVIMPKLAPIFGGLTVLIFFFIVDELLNNKKMAFISSLFLAVMPFHVYQTSHASPLTMGHFFMMLSLFFFVKFRKNNKMIIPLLASTVLLVMSHHLTTYFYLISLIFIVFVENFDKKNWTSTIKKDLLYIIISSSIIFIYWMAIARPVYESFMNKGIHLGIIDIGSNAVIPLFYTFISLVLLSIIAKRKIGWYRNKEKPTYKLCRNRFLSVFLTALSLMILFVYIEMPWIGFSFTFLSVLYSIPLLFIFAFGAAGIRHLSMIPNGKFIKGWLLAIVLSLIYGVISNNQVLFPHRHFEYMMAPLSIAAIYGIKDIFSKIDTSKLLKIKKKIPDLKTTKFKTKNKLFKKVRKDSNKKPFYIATIVLLLATNAMSIYPAHLSLNQAHEVITNEDLAAIKWINENLDENHTVIAADHRLERIAEAEGFNTTKDETRKIWKENNLSEYIDEIKGKNKNYSKITHILIDDIMLEKVVNVGLDEMDINMTKKSYSKFSPPIFELAYRNETINTENQKPLRWAEVYEVNWTYIEKKQKK